MLYSQGLHGESRHPAQRRRPRGERSSQSMASLRRSLLSFSRHAYRHLAHDELHEIFGITEKLNGASAQRIYDHLAAQMAKPEFRPRALFERFNIEVLCTTDAATDPLEHHQAIHHSAWKGVVRPTFRPDAVVNMDAPREAWRANIKALSQVSQINVKDYKSYIAALENRRAQF